LEPVLTTKSANFCFNMACKDDLGRELYMVSGKAQLSLYKDKGVREKHDIEKLRDIYEGAKSIADFRVMKNKNLIVCQNYTEIAILEPTTSGAYKVLGKIEAKDYESAQMKKGTLTKKEDFYFVYSFNALYKIKLDGNKLSNAASYVAKPAQVYDFQLLEDRNEVILNRLESSNSYIKILGFDNLQVIRSVTGSITMLFRTWYNESAQQLIGKEINGPVMKVFQFDQNLEKVQSAFDVEACEYRQGCGQLYHVPEYNLLFYGGLNQLKAMTTEGHTFIANFECKGCPKAMTHVPA